jgi:hypothetical protein
MAFMLCEYFARRFGQNRGCEFRKGAILSQRGAFDFRLLPRGETKIHAGVVLAEG